MVDFEAHARERSDHVNKTGGPAQGGLTVLDWFAGKAIDVALKRVMHNFKVEMPNENWTLDNHDLEMVAILAYRLADYLLRERNKRMTPANVVAGVTGRTYG